MLSKKFKALFCVTLSFFLMTSSFAHATSPGLKECGAEAVQEFLKNQIHSKSTITLEDETPIFGSGASDTDLDFKKTYFHFLISGTVGTGTTEVPVLGTVTIAAQYVDPVFYRLNCIVAFTERTVHDKDYGQSDLYIGDSWNLIEYQIKVQSYKDGYFFVKNPTTKIKI